MNSQTVFSIEWNILSSLSFLCITAWQPSEKENGLSLISVEALRSRVGNTERGTQVVCVLCNSTALQKFLRFLPTIALQRFYLPGLETLTCLSTKHHHYTIFSVGWLVVSATSQKVSAAKGLLTQQKIWDRQNAGMGSAGRGGFRRRNGGIGAAGGVRPRVLRTQSVGSPRLVAPFGAASPGDTRRQRKSLRRQKKVLRRQKKLLGRENAADRGGFF